MVLPYDEKHDCAAFVLTAQRHAYAIPWGFLNSIVMMFQCPDNYVGSN